MKIFKNLFSEFYYAVKKSVTTEEEVLPAFIELEEANGNYILRTISENGIKCGKLISKDRYDYLKKLLLKQK